MMQVKLASGDLRIDWQHTIRPLIVTRNEHTCPECGQSIKSPGKVPTTICKIFAIEYASKSEEAAYFSTVGVGYAQCKPGDQFSRSVGRKRALAQALKKSMLGRFDREEIWRKYFEMTHELQKDPDTIIKGLRRDNHKLRGELEKLTNPDRGF